LKKIISTTNSPGAIGPYSQGTIFDHLIFTSGQLPIHPDTGLIRENDVAEQTRQCLQNAKAILEEAGSSLGKALKTTVYMVDMKEFSIMNDEYKKFFEGNYPARSTVEVSRLAKDALVEIEVIAYI